MFLTERQASSYDALSSQETALEKDVDSSSTQLYRESKRHFSLCLLLSWLLNLILSICLALSRISNQSHDTYQSGFATELNFANETMGINRVRFVSDIQIDPNGTVYLSQDPNGPHYVGSPSPEIDRAWDDLLLNGDRFVGLTPEEVVQHTDFSVRKEDLIFDLYWIEPNSLHSIHCLNMLRKYSYHDYYTEIEDLPPSPFRITDRLHLDHCIDAIRQTLMCSFDTTPVPRPWRPEGGIYLTRIEQWHTCRKPDPVNNWLHWKNKDFTNEMFANTSLRWKDPNALYAKYYPW